MAKNKASNRSKAAKGGGRVLPALCNMLGTLLLVLVIGLSAPLTVPRLMGYEVFDVISGSMEPELPVGSAVYVKGAEPNQIIEGEVIAFYNRGSVVVHRVVENRISLGELVTKGDANSDADFEPIPYDAVVGRVVAHVPIIGAFMAVYASTMGKIYLLVLAALGVVLNLVGSGMRNSRRAKELEDAMEAARGSAIASDRATAGAEAVEESGDAVSSQLADYSRSSGNYARKDARTAAHSASKPAKPKRRAGSIVKGVLVAILVVAFLGSAGVIGYVNWQYYLSDSLYGDASDKYLDDNADGNTANGPIPPIKIDFNSLCAKNPDVVGWIYCPGTVINYPVLQGRTNDDYLYHDYTGDYNMNGSIFADCNNARGFADSNTIIYGHNMNSGSMFAGLEKWSDQDYYKEHPIMWLLTPTQDYKVELFSAHHESAYSTMYQIIHAPCAELGTLLVDALLKSSLHANAQLDPTLTEFATKKGVDLSQIQVDESNPAVLVDPTSHYVMLSTCAYLFDNDRYVLHGKLVPVNSAGGKAK